MVKCLPQFSKSWPPLGQGCMNLYLSSSRAALQLGEEVQGNLPASFSCLFLGQAWYKAGNSARLGQVAVCASLRWEGPVLDLAHWNPEFPSSPGADSIVSLCCGSVQFTGLAVFWFFTHTRWYSVHTPCLGALICRGFNFKESLRTE